MKETTRREYLWKHRFLGDLGFLMGVFDKKVWAINTSRVTYPVLNIYKHKRMRVEFLH